MSKSGLLNGKASKLVDDANMKALRDLSQVPCNRHCFDCAQRGPTYINTTIGSFVCMTCSGLLRGLTPPHRVKSISMASFSPEEIELLKSRGNEYCRKVWMATHTSRDSHIGSEQDPDRRNALKSHMSAKYEQKRYYVDPSKLPKCELTEIQAQTARALSSSASSISNSSGGSTMQKSPSLSSASSGSSLSLQQNQNNPSPVMNNLRNSQPHRLVNSVTLPDIKPLSSLIGSVNMHSSSNGNNHVSINSPAPINFINNLSNHDEKIINTNHSQNTKDPWGDHTTFANPNGFNADFANFDQAFCPTNGNGNFAPADLFNSPPTSKAGGAGSNGIISNGFPSSSVSSNNFANFDSLQQKPLVPYHGTNGHSNSNSQTVKETPPPASNGNGTSAQDRYAALKDLDDMFKHVDAPAGSGVSNGISSSASVPTNLSCSGGGPGAAGWYSTSPNQPNPFSQGGGSPPRGTGGTVTNGWGVNGTSANPFFPSPSWHTSNNNKGNGSIFPSSHSTNFHSSVPMSSSINSGGFPPMDTPPLGNLFSQNSSSHFSSTSMKGVLNPFSFSAATSGPSANPNNPFL